MTKSDKIRGYRHMLGKTQAQMAETLNISPQSYHNKECGKVRFTDDEKMIFKKCYCHFFLILQSKTSFFKVKVT